MVTLWISKRFQIRVNEILKTSKWKNPFQFYKYNKTPTRFESKLNHCEVYLNRRLFLKFDIIRNSRSRDKICPKTTKPKSHKLSTFNSEKNSNIDIKLLIQNCSHHDSNILTMQLVSNRERFPRWYRTCDNADANINIQQYLVMDSTITVMDLKQNANTLCGIWTNHVISWNNSTKLCSQLLLLLLRVLTYILVNLYN